jgi:hypothetical protein
MISVLLKEEIPKEVISDLWAEKLKDIHSAVAVVKLIDRIYKVISAHDLSFSERKYLRRDLVIRINKILQAWKSNPLAWKYFGLSFYRDPRYLPSIVKASLLKT